MDKRGLTPLLFKKNGPSGNRTRVLGFEAQEDVLYPMDPLTFTHHKILSVFRSIDL